ncbi:hypothetical protein [Pseudomonas fluorescens]|nr:hypothetical protein [Pseudomonas fluorescens]
MRTFDSHAPGLGETRAKRDFDFYRQQDPGPGMTIEPFAEA